MSLRYEPSSEPLHISAKYVFLNWPGVQVVRSPLWLRNQDKPPVWGLSFGVWGALNTSPPDLQVVRSPLWLRNQLSTAIEVMYADPSSPSPVSARARVVIPAGTAVGRGVGWRVHGSEKGSCLRRVDIYITQL